MNIESKGKSDKTKEKFSGPELKEVPENSSLTIVGEEERDHYQTVEEKPRPTKKDEGGEKPKLESLPPIWPGVVFAIVYFLGFSLVAKDVIARGAFSTIWMYTSMASMIWWGIYSIDLHTMIHKKFVKAKVETVRNIALTKLIQVLYLVAFIATYVSGIQYYFSNYIDPPAWLFLPVQIALLALLAREALWSYKLGRFMREISNQKSMLPGRLDKIFMGVAYAFMNGVGIFFSLYFAPFFAPVFAWITNRMIQEAQEDDVDTILNTKESKFVRYRPFSTVEQWFKHRFMSNKALRNKPFLLILMALMIPVLTTAGYQASMTFLNWITAILSDPNSTEAVTGITQMNNQQIARMFVLITSGIFSGSLLYYYWGTTHLQFTKSGITFLSRRRKKWHQKEQLFWSELESISIKGEGTNSVLLFNKKNGDKSVKLALNSVPSIEERQDILDAIERYAPSIKRSSEVILALQLPAEHSYTELWLQALAAPPKREKLQPLSPGALIKDDRYEIKGKLGVGGQGFAYLAMDKTTEKEVVLKEFILPVFVDIEVRKQALEVFEGEAKILSQLDHPQIVKLIDFMVEDHRAYLVLEHIDGKSLRDLVKEKGKLEEEEVKKLAKQMCSVLEYLHSQSPPVVHRDFTPDNLILNKDGTLKLIDFNVAQQTDSTTIAKVVGKQAYLPPEQFQGQPTTQSDIYAMGCTLHYLLTGDDPVPISESHPKESNGKLSGFIDHIVAKATAVKKENRYADATELLEELDYDIEEIEAEEEIQDNGEDALPPEELLKESEKLTAESAKTIEKEKPALRVKECEPVEASIVVDSSREGGEIATVPDLYEAGIETAAVQSSDILVEGKAKSAYLYLKMLSTAIGYFAVFALALLVLWLTLPSTRPIMDSNYNSRIVEKEKLKKKLLDRYSKSKIRNPGNSENSK